MTDTRADAFAEHLEHIQWQVRPTTLIPNDSPPLHPQLEVESNSFTLTELRKAIGSLTAGKSYREGDLPIECFKALADGPGPLLQPLLDLFNHCWHHKQFPKSWLTSRVVMIFKKVILHLATITDPSAS
jgi:hypothetical protein